MAEPGFEPSDLNFLHEHVFEGIWGKHDEPAYSRHIWTLPSIKVFFIMAGLVILVEFVGSRSWVIARYDVLHLVGVPVRMDDGSHSEPLLHLSQGRAVWDLVPRFVTSRGDPAQSAWFGIVALLNLAIFVIMGVAIPALLTDGAFGAPIVKSTSIQECLASDRIVGWVQYVAGLPRTDAIFHQCFDEVNEACDSQYYFTSPNIEKRRLDTCPFPRDVCQNQTKPFEISHMSISAYEVGVNSPSKLSLNHRLTCAPVVVENFQLFPNLSPNYSWVTARTTLDTSQDNLMNFSVRLSTVNGPNFLSKESSGLQMAQKRGPTDVTALPRNEVPRTLSVSQYQELIHESIRREDGQSFLIVYQAGRSLYNSAIDDPFFAAHNLLDAPELIGQYFLPDYEATALGCVEQYQLCIPTLSESTFCTSWGYMDQHFNQLALPIEAGLVEWEQAFAAASEKMALFSQVTEALSVYYYIALRNVVHNMSPLLRDQTSSTRDFDSEEEPWVLEVETWFMKAILNTIFRVRMGAKYHLADFSQYQSDPSLGEAFVQQWALCGRIMFRDANYTNINWIGFWTTTVALLFICFISYFAEQIHKSGMVVFTILAHPSGSLLKIWVFLRRLMQYLFCRSWWRAPTVAVQLYRLWQIGPFLNVFQARPTWYGQWPRETSAQASGLNDTNHATAQPSSIEARISVPIDAMRYLTVLRTTVFLPLILTNASDGTDASCGLRRFRERTPSQDTK